MGIAQKVARNFSDAVRARGQSYLVKGRVTLLAARRGEVVARVRGTSKYRVRLRMRGSKLLASCTCPYFSPQGEPCKHLWATLLMAEARGLLQSPPVFPVHLVPESPRRSSSAALPEAEGIMGLEQQAGHPQDSEPGMVGLGPAQSIRPGGRVGKPRGKARPGGGEFTGETGSWAQRTRGPASRDRRGSTVGRPKTKAAHGTGAGAGPPRAKAVNRNAKRLLVYVLDVAATLAQNQVVIDLAKAPAQNHRRVGTA